MQTRLTLQMEQELIEAARRYAEASGTSLSHLVADYFRTLVSEQEPPGEDWKASLSPITRRLVGMARGADLDEGDYYRHLEEKHR